MSQQTICYAPADLTNEEIQACLAVIGEGEAVDLESATAELPQAMLVAVTRDGKEIVAVGVIKRRRAWYANRIATKSEFTFDENIHELGYVAVKSSHRGRRLSNEITSKLLSTFQARPIFATTSNEHMKRTLGRAGFEPHGIEWPGKDRNLLSLWITAPQ